MEKVEVYVRFANEGLYYDKITVNPDSLKDPEIFSDEVFVTIDDIRVAIKKEDWDRITNIKEEKDV